MDDSDSNAWYSTNESLMIVKKEETDISFPADTSTTRPLSLLSSSSSLEEVKDRSVRAATTVNPKTTYSRWRHRKSD